MSPTRKFCTSCQREALVSAGRAHRMANGKIRFVCAACVQKMEKMKGATA
jgi:predicted SprT family Zn-dependent metalloprotease